jgi:hypothetical protein
MFHGFLLYAGAAPNNVGPPTVGAREEFMKMTTAIPGTL